MNNPFTSKTFVDIWMKHFGKTNDSVVFENLKDVTFYKPKYLPFYVNVGKNLTKGINYEFDDTGKSLIGKTVLIYDVPDYFKIKKLKSKRFKLKEVFQYKGFLMDISDFQTTDQYIKNQFSSKNRREFRSNERRLNTCFDISYKFFYGDISKMDYDFIFEHFYRLLRLRFSEKNTNYHHLNLKKWNYYKALVFPMIKEKRASFLVMYDADIPIGITLNFHSEKILFETITVFDVDYYKFSIGKQSILKLLDWCFENNYKVSDFSKGDFDYKRKWSNVVYDFHYHIIYDSFSLKSCFVATVLQCFFKFKLLLRTYNFNVLYRKFLFFIDKFFKKVTVNQSYRIKKIEGLDINSTYQEIDFRTDAFAFLKHPIYTYLFAHPEPVDDIKVYKHLCSENTFVVNMKSQQLLIEKD